MLNVLLIDEQSSSESIDSKIDLLKLKGIHTSVATNENDVMLLLKEKKYDAIVLEPLMSINFFTNERETVDYIENGGAGDLLYIKMERILDKKYKKEKRPKLILNSIVDREDLKLCTSLSRKMLFLF